MAAALFEILIYSTWTAVFISRLRRAGGVAAEELHVLLFALPTTVLMEMRAEHLHYGTGTYYPASLLYFPDFHFPVAIVFAGSLYAWALYAAARRLAARLARGGMLREMTHLAVFLLLLLSSRAIEWLSVGVGYWQWYNMPEPLAMWVGSYLYYFRFAFPAALVAKLFAWHANRSAFSENRGLRS